MTLFFKKIITHFGKFGNKPFSVIVNGEFDSEIVSDFFAYLSEVCCPKSADRHNQLKSDFHMRFTNYFVDIPGDIDSLTVELLDNILMYMKADKARKLQVWMALW
jgi:hypothetical protein